MGMADDDVVVLGDQPDDPKAEDRRKRDAWRRAFGDIARDVLEAKRVHLRGSACADTAPLEEKFTDKLREVTCRSCRLSFALLDGNLPKNPPSKFAAMLARNEIENFRRRLAQPGRCEKPGSVFCICKDCRERARATEEMLKLQMQLGLLP